MLPVLQDIKRDPASENIKSRLGLYTIPIITGLRLCITIRNHKFKCSADAFTRPCQNNYTLRPLIHQELPSVTNRKITLRVFPYSIFLCTHSLHPLETSFPHFFGV
ncbi:uncharacterized protein ACNLHF_020206 isoform 1-T1 [Anomaloglossus baeobatrachus]